MNTIHSKKHFRKTWPVLALLLICFTACEDLTESPSGIATPSTFYKTPLQCEAALNGAMAPLWGWYVSDSYGDGSGLGGTFVNDDQLNGGDLAPGEGLGTNLWNGHYKSITNINKLLDAVLNKHSLAKYTQEEVDEIVAQAKFLRAFNYFYLVRMFGALPLLTESTPDPILNPIKTRTPIADVYKLIVDDFTFAKDHLNYQKDPSRPGRPSGSAAEGFLAKAYLTMATAPLNDVSKYALAAQHAKAVIDNGGYSLVPNINDVFLQSNKYGSEQLWSLNSTVDDPQVDAFTGKPGELGGYDGETVDVLFESNFPKQPRRDAYILRYLTNADGLAGTDYELSSDNDTLYYEDFGAERPFIRKLYNTPNVSLDEQDGGSFANWMLLRYADILLIYAEAANRANNGPTPDAINAINQVISRANGATGKEPLTTLADPMLTFENRVIQERSWELCFEVGDRWFDLVRKRMVGEANKDNEEAEGNIPADEDNAYYYLFPIPTVDAGLIGQNPGYGG
jgi:hypothetical protein